VWVVAELAAGGGGAVAAASGPPAGAPTTVRARAHLLVTVPVYMAWFETEGGR
jgi:hypothetical protein